MPWRGIEIHRFELIHAYSVEKPGKHLRPCWSQGFVLRWSCHFGWRLLDRPSHGTVTPQYCRSHFLGMILGASPPIYILYKLMCLELLTSRGSSGSAIPTAGQFLEWWSIASTVRPSKWGMLISLTSAHLIGVRFPAAKSRQCQIVTVFIGGR